ncbi:MAG: DNA primase [Parvularculaceae bacterium]
MPRFTPEFIDELKARLRPSDVIGRYVKLKKRGNTWWGLSPFTSEKTPSFTVSDQRGTYHCFSSQNHGDIIKFLTDTQGLSFPEAVERLAAEAGMELPAEAPDEAERAERRKGLADACAAAAQYFTAMLRRADGRAGADYLARRGVTPEQIETFQLGFAPDQRTALRDHLINKGYTEETLVEAGLLIKPEEGGEAFDRFRGRVMFPILGPRDSVIAFGGRALDPNARAKYLNSPETPLLHKGDVLYNFSAARKAAADDARPLIVCEGYMDVIALFGAGLKRAVAPLGTAITESQFALLWRASDEPVLCLDGDAAGLSAAFRSIDRALALLKPGKSLSFAFLPDGKDPDDVVRAGGAAAMQKALDAALPLVEVLWRRETEARPLDTPERRAALRSHLRDLIKTIADKDVREAYGADVARRLDQAFAYKPASPARPAWRANRALAGRQATKSRGGYAQELNPRPSAGLKRRGAPSSWGREATLVLAALNHPSLADSQEAALHNLRLEDLDLDGLLTELMTAILADPGLDSAGLKRHLQATKAAETLERVLKDDTLNRQKFLRPEAEIGEVERGWRDALRHHLIATEARREVSDSASQSVTIGDDIWKAAVTAREELINSGEEERRESGDADVSADDFVERLERFRASVEGKAKR